MRYVRLREVINMEYEMNHRIVDKYGDGISHSVEVYIARLETCQVERLKAILNEMANECDKCGECIHEDK